MIPEQAWQLVPKELPLNLENWILNFADSSEFSDRERRAYIWANHLLSKLNSFEISTAILGLLPTGDRTEYNIADISAGFIIYQNDNPSARKVRMSYAGVSSVEVEGNNYAFGIVIGISMPESVDISENTYELSQLITIQGFPVLAEYRIIDEHAPPHPLGVVSSCYVKPRYGKRFIGPSWSDGIIIARHTLASIGFSTGVSVPMSSGVSMKVVDIDSATTIDAAIIDCTSMSSSASRLALATIAPGSLVNTYTVTRTFSATVLRIFEHPHYVGNMFSHRVFVDSVGIKGDSGSLVLSTVKADAVGIYIGKTLGTPPEGIIQAMRQIVEYFDVEIFN
ncbi:hypothetical protein GO730_00745 [Spirosoma sp. HMF3257]|uniref:Serine protease n=1 Tax=Spirosoma telluris TaxID=2183553 RepID=A0A327NDZ9_9BACT|nr:hypothetical protein [Spirosoma telluris]RAI73327.1 hypothetical protein HMF3257_00725 [Spirosoma telluris]